MPRSGPWQGRWGEAWEQWKSFPRWARILYGLACLVSVLTAFAFSFASRHHRSEAWIEARSASEGTVDAPRLRFGLESVSPATSTQAAAGDPLTAREAEAKPSPEKQSKPAGPAGREDAAADVVGEGGAAKGKEATRKKPDLPAQPPERKGTPAVAAPATTAPTAPAAIRVPGTSTAAASDGVATAAPDGLPAAEAPAPNPNQSVVGPAVKALLAVAKREDNPYHYIFPPVVQRKLEFQEVPQRFSVAVLMTPVFAQEKVTVTQPVTQGTQTLMTTTQQSIPGRPMGMRPMKFLVPDPSGPIVQMVKQPIWGPGGPDRQSIGWLGNNAMAIVALLRSGVTPQREPALKTLTDRLSQYLQAFDSPDSTWDVAWAIIAFAEYPGGRYHDRLERLLGKLLSGQIAAGPGKGLWGPVCVNPALVRQAVESVFKNQAAMPQAGVGVARSPALPQGRPAVHPAQAALQRQIVEAQERAFIELNAVSTLCPSFAQATHGVTLKDARNQFGNDVEVPGWPVNAYRELTADLESTALAAYALRVVTMHHRMPAAIEYPRGVACCRSFSIRDALAAALRAIAAAQRDDGAWDEMVAWQPVDEFRDGGVGQFGMAAAVPEALPCRHPPIATAEACNALEDLLLVLGRVEEPKKATRPAKGKGRPPEPVKPAEIAQYREQIDKGRRHLLEMVAEVSKGRDAHEAIAEAPPARNAKRPAGRPLAWRPPAGGPTPAGGRLAGPQPVDPVWGGPLEPYALLCQLRLEADADSRPDAAAAGRIALGKLMTAAVGSQAATGLWPAPDEYMPWTPSLRERSLYLVAPPAAPAKKAPSHPAKRTLQTPGPKAKSEHGGKAGGAAAHAPDPQPARTAQDLLAVRARVYFDPRFWSVDAKETERLATVYMLCYLAGTQIPFPTAKACPSEAPMP
ncbi:MAG: hypothetical protein ABSG86_18355 [Thermoguttaceae bacterium]